MMKSSYKFFLSMMVLFILMFLLQMQLPRSLCGILPSIMPTASLSAATCSIASCAKACQGYQVTAKTFRQLDEENRNRKIAVVVLDNSLRLKKVDVGHLRKIAQRGGKVMVAYHWGGSDELDSGFHVDMSSGAFYWIISCEGLRDSQDVYDTLTWCGSPLAYPQREYRLIRAS